VGTKEDDLAAWKKWNSSQNMSDLQSVLKRLDPIVHKEVNRWQGTLARPLLELEAKRLAIHGIRTYRPTAGAALSTHVTNQLKKLSRISYTHQNIARIPEYQTLKFHTFNNAQKALEDKLGRDPTAAELSGELGWSRPYLSRFQRSFRREFVESGTPAPIFDSVTDDAGLIDFVYHDMSPQQKSLFEHTTGYGGAEVMSNPKLMKKLHVTQGQLSYQKRLLADHISALTDGGVS
jgi:hypothetical protein